jgi:hypothetical protein
LLLTNISPNPNNRIPIERVNLLYKEIFYMHESTKNYLELINNFKYSSLPVKIMLKNLSALPTKN